MQDQFSDSQLQLQESSLKYLDKTQQLEKLKKECLAHSDSKESTIYPFIIKIDCTEITEIDAILGNVVLHQPQEARKIFQEVCYVSLTSLNLLPAEVTCSQVLVNLQLLDLPHLKSYQLSTAELLGCKFDSRFYKFAGTVCSISSPIKYSRCAKYRCPESKCYGAADNFYIRCHIEGAKEQQTVRRDFNCVYCGSILKEDVTCRVLGERVTVQMVEGDVFPLQRQDGDTHSGRYCQSVTVMLRDEFFNMQLGGCYCVIGIPVKEFTGNSSVSVMIEANNVFKMKPRIPTEPRIHLSETLRQLLANRAQSPWSFSASLAYLFAEGVTPPGTYHRLKLCILLSIIDATSRSYKNDSQGFLDLVAVGADSNLIRRLLIYGASYARRAIIHSGSQPLLASLHRDPSGPGCYTIDGGSTLLAHQGVCVLGEIDSLKRDAKQKLQNVLEHRVIQIDLPRQLSSGSSQQQLFPVECNLWGYANSYKTQEVDEESLFSASEVKRTPKQSIVESFPMVLVCDSPNPTMNEHAELNIIKQTLLGAMADPDQLGGRKSIIGPSEIKQFLEIASATTVEFSAPAKQLLKGYFVGSRRVRSSGVHGTPFPPMALQTLACMSRALAKLNLRNTVLEEDAAFAVLLYEEAVTARYGYSILNIQSKPHFRDGNISEHLGPENDAFMRSFMTRLSRFCRSHVPDFNMYESED
ncbi:minichromosome maintenance domain-containing protein 2-like [Patiria miniata]|uniref:Uncharacterized protein n=1 Tax=Patiria miniata TaxID=46514 RepID=A0A913ZX56_PATMI|nr:minichromosome maintenance domain-containing protein 2-like [Patiria miniata]